MMINKNTDFKQIYIKHRYMLTGSFNHLAPGTDAENAKLLVSIAVKNGFLESERKLPGTSFKNWSKNKKAGEWACKAAAAFLVTTDYVPREMPESVAMAYQLAVIHQELSVEEIKSKLSVELVEKLPLDEVANWVAKQSDI